MTYKEAADRIEEHMIIHKMAEYCHAKKITEALYMAVVLLRERDYKINSCQNDEDFDWSAMC